MAGGFFFEKRQGEGAECTFFVALKNPTQADYVEGNISAKDKNLRRISTSLRDNNHFSAIAKLYRQVMGIG